jgi:hypothetical protein
LHSVTKSGDIEGWAASSISSLFQIFASCSQILFKTHFFTLLCEMPMADITRLFHVFHS